MCTRRRVSGTLAILGSATLGAVGSQSAHLTFVTALALVEEVNAASSASANIPHPIWFLLGRNFGQGDLPKMSFMAFRYRAFR